MTIIDKIVFSQNAPAKNTLWARPSEKGTELLIFNKGKWGTVGADDFQRFHYEVYSSLEDITEPKPNALYLIGPKGEGEDKYDEYIYTEEGFTKIGDTSIDMSDVTKYNKNSDDSYTLKAEGTEIKKLRMVDDSTMTLGNNNSIEFGASGTINMQSGNISGVNKLTLITGGLIEHVGNIDMDSAGVLNMKSGVLQNVGTIDLADGGSSVQIRFRSGALPVITFDQEYFPEIKVLEAVMSLGKDKALSVISYFNVLTLQPSETPVVSVSGTLEVSEKIYAGKGIVSAEEVHCTSSIICPTISSTLQGTIENTTFNSGNTFTTGFIDELKTALGIS